MDGNLTDYYEADYNYSTIHPLYDFPFAGFTTHTRQTHGAVFGVILSIWTVVLNFLVICTILCERRTRIDVYFLQIMNMAAANVFTGLFVIPLTVYSILQPWNLGTVLCKFWIIFDVLLSFASMLTLVILNLDRLILMIHPKTYKCLFQTCLKPIILMTPWLTSMIIVVPLWTHGALLYELRPGECVIMLIPSAAVACSVITYFFPLSIIIFITVKILLVRMFTDRQNINVSSDRSALKLSTFSPTNEQTVNTTEDGRVKHVSAGSIAAICIANFLFCSLWFPYQFVTMLMTVCTWEMCLPSAGLSKIVTWMATASAGVVPLAWFADKKMKRSCTTHICRAKSTDSGEVIEVDL